MNEVSKFVPFVGAVIGLQAITVVVCLVMYAYRARKLPPIKLLFDLFMAGFMFWFAIVVPESGLSVVGLVLGPIVGFVAMVDALVAIRSLRTEKRPIQPEDLGFPSDVSFEVTRGGKTAGEYVTWDGALDFLDACGIEVRSIAGEATLVAILSGNPLHIDGADISFKPVLKSTGKRA